MTISFVDLVWLIFNYMLELSNKIFTMLFSKISIDPSDFFEDWVDNAFINWLPTINLDITWFELLFGTSITVLLGMLLLKFIIGFFK